MIIRNVVEHKITSTSRCKSCGNTKVITDNHILVSISINNLKKKSYNLNDLLNITFSHWVQGNNESCKYCGENAILIKRDLVLAKEIVIIHLVSFSLQDDKLVKIPGKFSLCSVPTSKILIAEQSYKVMSAIFHHGLCIETGRYTNMCRERTSSIWIETNDTQVSKKQWPKGAKDIYILFLEKVVNK
ncbi:hypothetical protein X777_12460 [Ooceraea biroi]|uniref:USP domain-containing protein n=1 Tax=Ooceraea biroi TaxID=2015173 RepID=A0A026W2K3_OOCBI|nr:hypothetical protein X777_12460 [Ooceraea biroi]